MRANSWRVRGLISYPNDVSVDFNKIPGTVVAIVGENGAGKSQMIESLLAACDAARSCPTRGSLKSLARDRDSVVDVNVTVNGSPIRIRHRMDGVSGAAKSDVWDHNGKSLLPDDMVSSFSVWAKKHMPDQSVLLASTFAAQGQGGFLALKGSDRADVMLRVKGVERLRVLAKLAGEHARDAKARFNVADGKLVELKAAGGTDETKARIAVVEADGRLGEQSTFHQFVIVGLGEARRIVERVTAHNADVQKLHGELAAAQASHLSSEQRRNALVSRIADVRETFEGAEEARAAAKRVGEIDEDLAKLRVRVAGHQAELTAAKIRCDAAVQAKLSAAFRVIKAEEATRGENLRLAERAKLLEKAALLPAAEKGLAEAERALQEGEAKLDGLRSHAIVGAEGRIVNLRGALEEYTDKYSTPGTRVAIDALDADNAAVKDQQERPKAIQEATVAIQGLRSMVETCRLHRDGCRAAQARAEGMTPATGLEQALGEAEREVARQAAIVAKAKQEIADVETELGGIRILVDGLTEEQADLASTAARLPEIASAETLLVELDAQLTTAEADLSAVQARLASLALDPIPDPLPVPDVVAAEAKARDAERWLAEAKAAVSNAERELEVAVARSRRVAEITVERESAAEELSDWNRLAADLGRDGLQSIEIDSASPELTTLTNDLLHACVGPRWTVTIEMCRASEDAKKEECKVRVLDMERGSDVLADVLSGGEGVIVGEAISLALSVMACRQWGVDAPTLIRDESAAALSQTNTRAYASMLRRAAGAIGASKLLVITHNQELADLCDSRLHVHDGMVEIAA